MATSDPPRAAAASSTPKAMPARWSFASLKSGALGRPRLRLRQLCDALRPAQVLNGLHQLRQGSRTAQASMATSRRAHVPARLMNYAVRWASWPGCQEVNEENPNERGSPCRHELWRDRSGSRAETAGIIWLMTRSPGRLRRPGTPSPQDRAQLTFTLDHLRGATRSTDATDADRRSQGDRSW
jgi:hypothetical protein